MTTLKWLVEFFLLSPVGIVTLFFGLALLMFLLRRKTKAGQRLLFVGACLYILFLFTPLANFVVEILEYPYPPLLNAPSDSDIEMIVILCGEGWYNPAVPIRESLSPETAYRTLEAVRLYRQRPELKLLFSGGTSAGPGHIPIAKLMAQFADSLGVPESSILIETSSRTTRESLVEVQRMLHNKRFIMVTSAYHLRRAMGVAHKLQMNPMAAPAWIKGDPEMYRTQLLKLIWSWDTAGQFVAPRPSRFDLLRGALLEYAGYAWYWARGWV